MFIAWLLARPVCKCLMPSPTGACNQGCCCCTALRIGKDMPYDLTPVPAGIIFDQNDLGVRMGSIPLMEKGQPLTFDKVAANKYLKVRPPCCSSLKCQFCVE
jgi:hypothetical protein